MSAVCPCQCRSLLQAAGRRGAIYSCDKLVLGFKALGRNAQHLLDWLDEARLDRVGCFQYENVAGARANALPDHVFAAQRGFYVGWMDTSGNWLYCQSIFSSATADDEPSYGY